MQLGALPATCSQVLYWDYLARRKKIGRVYNTFKGKNLKSIVKSEATAIGTQVIVGALPGAIRSVANKADGVFFPTATAARNQATVNQINQGQIAGGGV